jgi:hypothetical protein
MATSNDLSRTFSGRNLSVRPQLGCSKVESAMTVAVRPTVFNGSKRQVLPYTQRKLDERRETVEIRYFSEEDVTPLARGALHNNCVQLGSHLVDSSSSMLERVEGVRMKVVALAALLS